MSEDDLFSWRPRYPDVPGTKAPGTACRFWEKRE